jgi:hypothetical protein
VILETTVGRSTTLRNSMKPDASAIYDLLASGELAARPLTRPVTRQPLSLLVAGTGLLPRRFAAGTRPDAPSGTPNYRFKDHP